VKQRRKSINEAVLPDIDLDVQTWEEMPVEQLGVGDELGWAPIHHAAQKGAVHIIKRALDYNNQLMEQKTIDVAAVTPLLVAVQVSVHHLRHYYCYARSSYKTKESRM